MSADALTISAVPKEQWPDALALLFATFPADELADRIAATLMAVEVGQLSLNGLRWARRDGVPVAAALTMTQPDGITLVWPPALLIEHRDDEEVADALLAHLTMELDAAGTKFSQVLIDTVDDREQSRLIRHGYQRQTELFFLGRALSEPLPTVSGEASFESITLAECDDRNRFAALLGRTYQGTHDCPWMNGVRTAAEALACHRQSGQHDPALWRIYTSGGDDAALCLLSDHPEQDAVELVYFGVVPEFRGRGLGRRLLHDAVRAAADRNRSVLFLAVDAENRYANLLYSELDFTELARRRALFRECGGSACE
jgi:GNAT superfamily N-acetyltransferase